MHSILPLHIFPIYHIRTLYFKNTKSKIRHFDARVYVEKFQYFSWPIFLKKKF